MDTCETKIFVDILKLANGGKLWKTINEGTAKRQDQHNVWIRAAELFSKETDKKIDWTQAKSKWQRIRQYIKKKNDKKEKDKEFRKQCSLTSGGIGPSIPEQEDGDDVDVDLHLNDMDPTDTDFNGLVRPEDKMESQ